MLKSILIIFLLLTANLISLASPENNSKEEVLNLIKKGISYWTQGKIDSAIIYLNHAEKKSKNLNDSVYLVACYNNLGILYTDTGKYLESLDSFQNAYNHLSDTLSNEASKILLNIGIVYRKLGNYEEALANISKALISGNKVLTKQLKASFYNEYAIVKKRQLEFYTAIEYLSKSLEIYKTLDDKKNVAGALNNIGNCYKELRRFDIALSYLNESIILKKKLGNKKLLSIAYINIGDIQLSLKDIKNAESSLMQALKLKQGIKDKAGIATTCTLLGKVYNETKQYNKAETYLLRGKKIAEEIKALDLQKEVYQQLKNLYVTKGDMPHTIAFYDLYLSTRDSIFSTESVQNMQRLETQFKTREKEQEIKVLNLENENKDLQLTQSKQESIYLATGLLLILLSLFPVTFLVKNRQKNKLLEERITGKNKECNRISRELHDGVVSSLSYLCKHMEQEDSQNTFIEKLRSISDEVRGISHQLNMNAIGSQRFKSALSDSLHLNHFPAEIKLQIVMGDDFEIGEYNTKVNTIRIVQELVNNSLKHAQASTIVIKFRQDKKKLFLEYADNGIGMDMQQLQKGNGLINIEERVAYLSGKMEIVTSAGNGFYMKAVISV